MIITTTLNAAVDITYTVEDFSLNKVHRPQATKITAGGKGINVSRVLRTLGAQSTATGFVAGRNGELILESLDREGISYDFVQVEGESRLCIQVVDPVANTQTEVNEPGPTIPQSRVDELLGKILDLLKGASCIIMSGSAPPGVASDFYAKAIRMAKDAGVLTALDTSGEHLSAGIHAIPDILKPNVAELSALIGHEIYTTEEAVDAAVDLARMGISTVAVSMGRSGAIITDGTDVWHAQPPEISFVSAVGSGDSMMASLVDSLMKGRSLPEALAAGTAAGAANATVYGSGCFELERMKEMLSGVTVARLR